MLFRANCLACSPSELIYFSAILSLDPHRRELLPGKDHHRHKKLKDSWALPNMFDHLRRLGRVVWPYALFTVVIIPITTVVTTVRYDSKFRVVYSLDKRDTDSEIIRLINGADRYVYFAIYYFTKTDIADALIRAQKRGVTVWGITDAVASLDSNKNIMDILHAAGISVETQKHQDGIMHMKAVVTDKAYASGSYNWTDSATESNDEVLEIGTDRSVHDQYLDIIKKVLLANQ